jgi:hypothetical protein
MSSVVEEAICPHSLLYKNSLDKFCQNAILLPAKGGLCKAREVLQSKTFYCHRTRNRGGSPVIVRGESASFYDLLATYREHHHPEPTPCPLRALRQLENIRRKTASLQPPLSASENPKFISRLFCLRVSKVPLISNAFFARPVEKLAGDFFIAPPSSLTTKKPPDTTSASDGQKLHRCPKNQSGRRVRR